MNETNLEQQLILINQKLDRITNPFKVAGLQFTAGIFRAFGNLFGTILIAVLVYYVFSSLNLGEYLNQYIQNLIPKPQINIQSPF
ncbi:MAG: hypothetical protein WC069_02520 [Candidatus Shapirobacteria bacterium]